MSGLRPCQQHGCPVLVTSGGCPQHGGPLTAWRSTRHVETPRLRGRANQDRRRRLFAREPFCRLCAAKGLTAIATIRDHIVPLAEGGAENDDANEQPLCQACSDVKTAEESKRGHANRL
jgi:5-methylcytosine-specific restriction protein A